MDRKKKLKFPGRMITLLGVLIISVFLLAYLFQEKLMFFPEKLPDDYVFSFENKYEEINFEIEKNVTINSLLFTVQKPKGLILYFHGNAGCLRSWGELAQEFTKYNYDILIIDYRTFGKSTGKLSEKALLLDGQYIYHKMKSKYEEEDIIIYGRSIGTGIAAFVASSNNPKQLILESPYYNFPDMVKKIYPFLPGFLVRYKLRNDLYIRNVSCPISIFHGTNDEVIYSGSSLKLKKLLKKSDSVFLIQGGRHNDLSDFQEYNICLARILE